MKLVALLLLCWTVSLAQVVPRCAIPSYSAKAVCCDRTHRVFSPDHSKSVAISTVANDDGFTATVILHVGMKKFTAKIHSGLNAEVLWSPDSTAFSVTGSRTGANGVYLTEVFVVSPDGLASAPADDGVRRAFGHPVKCGWPEDANVGAVQWLDGSRLLIAAEIMNHSNCDSFGTFKLYEVAIPSAEILKTYSQLEAKKLFASDLGSEIKDAPDRCVRTPKSCWVASNHGDQLK